MSAQRRLERLFELVPEIYRQRDEAQGHPLRAFLRVLAEQANVLEDDLGELYDDWFIETCREDLVPYLGELVGIRPSEEAGGAGVADGFEGRLRRKIVTPRREIARAVALRRRKGTLPVLEELAGDMTGWPARAVEFRTRLAVTQNVRHVHGERGKTIDVRGVRALTRLAGPFDTLAHTVDVRNVDADEAPGRYDIPSVGVFAWRIPGFSVTRSRVFRHERAGNPEDGCYSFNVLGIDNPLYTRATAELGAAIEGPADVPMRLSRREFAADPARYAGEGKSLQVLIDGEPTRRPIVPAELSSFSFPVPLVPTDGLERPILVDPELGRFMLLGSGRRELASVRATWHYGLSAAIGGGEYERRTIDPQGVIHERRRGEEGEIPTDAVVLYRVSSRQGEFSTLSVALEQWSHDDPMRAVIELDESEVYTHHVEIRLKRDQQLVVRAAEGRRPIVRILDQRPDLRDAFLVRAQANTRFTLDGLMITGRAMRVEGELRRLELRHVTLVPARTDVGRDDDESTLSDASLQLDRLGEDAEVSIEHSILGPIVVEDRGDPLPLCISDSIIDALGDRSRALWSGRAGNRVAAQVALQIRRSTVFGELHAHVIDLAEDSIFSGCVHAERRQRGCMRFCSLHCGEATPRRFHCQPDQAIEAAGAQQDQARAERIARRVQPVFASRRYGDPEYARLADHTDSAVRRGAHDESEMGVFHDLFTPQRTTRLRDALHEFVPADADVGLIPVT
jgi:hypothetical protein